MVDPVTGAEVRVATGGWWLLLLVGVLSIAAGIIILIKPGDSLATLAVIAGIFLLLDGILELVASLMRGTQSRTRLSRCSLHTRTSASFPSCANFKALPRRLEKHCVNAASLPMTSAISGSTLMCERELWNSG